MRESLLLVIDAAINLVLGILLVTFPESVVNFLGVPVPESHFYASLLGAVFIGIGIALLVERFRDTLGFSGLGLGGAICINLCGSVALMLWLVSGQLDIPVRGYVFLGLLALMVFGIGLVEIMAYALGGKENQPKG
jgi:hypothetical protein